LRGKDGKGLLESLAEVASRAVIDEGIPEDSFIRLLIDKALVVQVVTFV